MCKILRVSFKDELSKKKDIVKKFHLIQTFKKKQSYSVICVIIIDFESLKNRSRSVRMSGK